MAEANPPREMTLLLSGKTGNGKSSVRNAILGREKIFESTSDSISKTEWIHKVDCARFENREITVIDFPGFHDTRMRSAKSNLVVGKCFILCSAGISAVLFVLKFGNGFTEDERETVNNLKKIFGDSFLRTNCVLIFTHGDQLDLENDFDPSLKDATFAKREKSFREWLDKQKGDLGRLIKECQGRCVLFRNLSKDWYDHQRKELITAVDKLKPYRNKLLEKVRRKRETFIQDQMVLLLDDTLQKKISFLQKSISVLLDKKTDDSYRGASITSLIDDAESVIEEINDVDKAHKTLEPLHLAVQDLRQYGMSERTAQKDDKAPEHKETLTELKKLEKNLIDSLKKFRKSKSYEKAVKKMFEEIAQEFEESTSLESGDTTSEQELKEEKSMAEKKSKISLLLLGKTGNGKSSTGNAILGRKEFITSSDGSSQTHWINARSYTRVNGEVVEVIDTPGLFDTDITETQSNIRLHEGITKAMLMCPEGFDALIVVLKYSNRFFEEDNKVIQILKKMLGPDVIHQHAIILFTNGEQLDMEDHDERNFQRWLTRQIDQKGKLGTLIEDCENRCVLFRNMSEDKYDEQREELMAIVAPLKRYTSEIFQRIKSKRDAFIMAQKGVLLQGDIQKNIGLLRDSLKKTKKSLRKGEKNEKLKESLDFLFNDAQKTEIEIEEVDTHLNVLNQLRIAVRKVKEKAEKISTSIEEKKLSAVEAVQDLEVVEERLIDSYKRCLRADQYEHGAVKKIVEEASRMLSMGFNH